MTNSTGVEVDPSVCYRHPGRQSWVLCQRCGRTICPECQILAPVGVHCPECVRETSGGVQWRPVSAPPPKAASIRRSRRAGRVRSLLARDSGIPVATRAILAVSVVLWILGFATIGVSQLGAGLPTDWLTAQPGFPAALEIWRYGTAVFVYPAGLSFIGILGFLLNGLFFYLNGPMLERMLGVRRFLATFFASAVVGVACSVLSGGIGYGLIAPLFGLFAALLVLVWQDQRARSQILIAIAINLVLNIVVGGGSALPTLIGGMVAGAGATYLFRIASDRSWKPRSASLIIAASAAGFVVLAIARGVLAP